MKKLKKLCCRRVLTPAMSKKYHAQEEKRLVTLYKMIIPVTFVITLLAGLVNFILNTGEEIKIQTGIIFGMLIGVQVFHYIAIILKPDYFNIWQQISVLAQHLMIIKYILHYSQDANVQSTECIFFMGYSFGIVFYLFANGTNQFVKIILVLSLFVEIVLFMNLTGEEMTISICILMFFTCLVASMKIIQDEKRKQRLFLTFESNQIWQKVIEQFLPINILMIEYDQNNQRIVLNSSNLFTKQNLNIYNDDDLQLFLDVAYVHQFDDLQKKNAKNAENATEYSKQHNHKKSTKYHDNNSSMRDCNFSLSPQKKCASGKRKRSQLQINKGNGQQRVQRSQTTIKRPSVQSNDKKCKTNQNYREKKNLKHHLKEFMIQATEDKNLNRKVYQLRIEYESENDVKLYQLKILPFFFDQNYAIITIDNLSNEERLKNKDDILQVSNHLNNHCRQRIIQNTEKIIRNFIQVQNEVKSYFERNDLSNAKSMFSILQSSTFQMCQRSINQVKNVQTLSSSKKKIPIKSQRFSLLDQIRTILKIFSYELHKNNQKFKLLIDSTPYPALKPSNISIRQLQKQPSNNINFFQMPNKDDESTPTVTMSKQASQYHLGVISQIDIQKSPTNGQISSFNSYNTLNQINQKLGRMSANQSLLQYQFQQIQQNNNYSDNQQNQQMQSQDASKYFFSSKIIPDCNAQTIGNSSPGIEFQQSSAMLQLFLGMKQEEIIDEENEKNEEASNLNSQNLSQKLGYIDNPNQVQQKSNEENNRRKESSCSQSEQVFQGNKIVSFNQRSSRNNLDNIKNSSRLFQECDSTQKGECLSDIRTQSDTLKQFMLISQSIDFLNVEEKRKSFNQKNSKQSTFSKNNNNQNLINSTENYNMSVKFRILGNSKQPLILPQKSLEYPIDNKISPFSNKITSQNQEIFSQNKQTSPQISLIYPLNGEVSPINSLSSSPNNQITPPNNQICPLKSSISLPNNQIYPPNNQISPLSTQISPPNSLLLQIQQSPLNSIINSFSYDKNLNGSDFINLNESLHSDNLQERLDSSEGTIPVEGHEINNLHFEKSVQNRIQQNPMQGYKSQPCFHNNKGGVYQENLIFYAKQDFPYDAMPSPQKQNKTKCSQFLDMNIAESKFTISQNRLSNSESPTKKYSDIQTNFIGQMSHSQIHSSPLPSFGNHMKDTIQFSSSNLSQNSSSSSESSISLSRNSSTQNKSYASYSNQQKETQKQYGSRQRISQTTQIIKKKAKDKKVQKHLKKLKKQKVQQRFSIGSQPHNLNNISIVSNDYQNISQFGDSVREEDIFVNQDVGRVNNILYNFIENSIIHSVQNSEIFMRIIKNPLVIEGEKDSQYITLEITNTSLYDIEETKKNVESSQEYYFHDQHLIDQIIEEESDFPLGLRSTRKNLRYLGPFDQINYSYDFQKNKVKQSFSIYKNIEVLYPESPASQPTRFPLSPQPNLINQIINSNSNSITKNVHNPKPEDQNIFSPGFQFKSQQFFNQPKSSEFKNKNSNQLNVSPQKSKERLSVTFQGREQSQLNGNSLGSQTYKNPQQYQRKRNSLLIQKDMNLSTSRLKSPATAQPQCLNKSQNLDLSQYLIQRFRNNSVYNETNSKQLSRDSSQQVPTHKQILTHTQLKQKSMLSLNSNNDNITQSISIQGSSSAQSKGYPILNKISTFNKSQFEDHNHLSSSSMNIEQDIKLFKQKLNSLKFNEEEGRGKNELKHSHSIKQSSFLVNKQSNNNITNSQSNQGFNIQNITYMSNPNIVNSSSNNQIPQEYKTNYILDSSICNDTKKSMQVNSNNNQYSQTKAEKNDSIQINRSQKLFTFIQ